MSSTWEADKTLEAPLFSTTETVSVAGAQRSIRYGPAKLGLAQDAEASVCEDNHQRLGDHLCNSLLREEMPDAGCGCFIPRSDTPRR